MKGELGKLREFNLTTFNIGPLAIQILKAVQENTVMQKLSLVARDVEGGNDIT